MFDMNKNNIPKAICILGPTAAGKTKLGVELADRFNGEIVSADSRQVYRHLDICTGKDKDDYKVGKKKIPYHLIDILELNQSFSAAQFQKKAFKTINDIIKRNEVPFLVGGSPFYVYSVTEGWKFKNYGDNSKLRESLEKLGLDELKKLLKETDPLAYTTIDINNPRRLQRAVEVCLASGKKFKECKPKSDPKYQFIFLGITSPLQELKKRIEKRLKERIEEGMIEEVERVIQEKKASWKDLEEKGLEPKYISHYLQRKITKKEMEQKLIKNIYLFARRQMNWFRKDKRIKWVGNMEEAENHVKNFLKK